MLLPNPKGNYSFLEGIAPYSAGVKAGPGFAIRHVRFSRPVPWRTGFERMERLLESSQRPKQALCAVGLRSPEPMSFGGFHEFNAAYIDLLQSWGVLMDGVNPVARTNVAPECDPPAEPSLFSFAYTVPDASTQPSFAVSGSGELPEGSLDPREVVRAGDVSIQGLAAKARFVMEILSERLRALQVEWNNVAVTNAYTVHDLNSILKAELLPRMGRARNHGVTWHYARPPVISIEYEMDARSCAEEILAAV